MSDVIVIQLAEEFKKMLNEIMIREKAFKNIKMNFNGLIFCYFKSQTGFSIQNKYTLRQ